MILEWRRTVGKKTLANCDLWLDCVPPTAGINTIICIPFMSLLFPAISKDQCFIVFPSEEVALQCWVKQVSSWSIGVCAIERVSVNLLLDSYIPHFSKPYKQCALHHTNTNPIQTKITTNFSKLTDPQIQWPLCRAVIDRTLYGIVIGGSDSFGDVINDYS